MDFATARAIIEKRVEKDDCWVWQGATLPKGYGKVRWNFGGCLVHTAHRGSYMAFVGPIPAGAFVCHTCDNPRCVNPAHLFLGSPQDNVDDMLNKGRGFSKMSEAKAAAIRAEYATGARQVALAKKHGVSQQTVSLVVRGERWIT